ncbi:MAG: type II toxin-antitoxin system VapB family antitoxin [Archangium sp.]|nr:type II toxin-antitoxin system VapB family antitoxin [Archangium sp.]
MGARLDADEYAGLMQTVRTTLNLDAELMKQVQLAHPGETKTHLIELGLRALLAKKAARLLMALGGKYPRATAAKRRRFGHGAG